MANGQNQTLKEIMNQVEGVELKEKHGGTFRFRMHLTQQMEETKIEALELSVRSYHCLKRAGYETVGELAESIAAGGELMKIRNCGAKSIREIMEKLFVFQYESLSPARRKAYLQEVTAMNIRSTGM